MQPLHQPDGPLLPGASRRTFLRATALTGAATAATGLASAAPAAARAQQSTGAVAAGWRPDPENPRFTLVVMPDTQYLFDGASIDKAPVEASLRYVLDHGRDENIVFLSHLGDLTESGQAGEFAAIGEAFELLDRRRVGYSVVAGNHDIKSSTDDQRGRTPYLDTFGPKRMRRLPTFGGATPDGYNTYHLFRAAGREWLVLALDWRPSAAGLAWAKDVIAQHPRTPVILTTHELVYANADGDEAELSDHGQHLWDELIAGNDQIFLTLNGHYWPAGRTTRKNTAGNDVHLHITNYQNRYYGGSAMIRLYRFDLARNTIDVETISPWVLGRAGERLNDLERGEIELTGPQDCFAVPIDFEKRFAGFAPVPVRGPRPAERMLIPGTVAYWRFDSPSHRDGSAADSRPARPRPVRAPQRPGARGRPRQCARRAALVHLPPPRPARPRQPLLRRLEAAAARRVSAHGEQRTAQHQDLQVRLHHRGLPPPPHRLGRRTQRLGRRTRPPRHPRRGREDLRRPGGARRHALRVGRSRTPVGGGALNQPGAVTNWSHELLRERWWHVAVVNDGKHTTMYIDGCVVARNPATRTTGLATLGLPWLLGAYEYGGSLDQLMHGWLGDIRIVERALRVKDFMIA